MRPTTGSVEVPQMMRAGDRAAGRRWPWMICLAITAGILAWGGWLIISERRFESGMAEVRRLMDADRFAEARPILVRLLSGWSDRPRGRLSSRASARTPVGDIPAAMAAWERVDPRSAWALRAGLARARTLVGDLGRFSEAEVILQGLHAQPRLRPRRGASYPRGALLLGGAAR